ncbi:E3 ubiquitin-protein ligase parkin isoform X2 [Pseudomyrmex gracilis]|uniref:E3 ubiquitin-protein ligase parkin isoform X2 n=1 Tax=Pseudomyrmex gracilis TaxID=219809 RepID=UPI000995774A|nr:E3 ubiquitin-protein ligase parkin isoform X2 [Pseudomyrmex gracilis]
MSRLYLQECDLGQQSILHAVRTICKPLKRNNAASPIEESTLETSDSSNNGSKPLNETLMDLPLAESDQNSSLEGEQQENRAHFYVYCSVPCKKVTTGKLRVKCARCGSGAVTVDRDPQCWPDVLLPKRITVHCENDSCPSSSNFLSEETESQICFANFYFKCAEHLSLGESDEAVPLYLIKTNLKNVPCLACTDVRETVLVFSCKAGHVTCLDCFRDYCAIRLQERRFEFDSDEGYYTLPCPAGCPDSFIREVHHFHLLSAEQYERYQRFSTEEYVLQAGGLLCPQPNCGMGIIPPDIQDDKDCRRIQCIGGCGYVFCRLCLQGYHVGECESQTSEASTSILSSSYYSVDPLNANKATWDEASKKTIQICTKPCPKCRTPTEKDGGCMHMVCTRAGCGYHWCWVCQTEWTRECMGNHWFG